MIRQPIFDITLNENVHEAYNRVARNLSGSEFTVINSDPTAMRISIGCIVKLFDMGLWSCWGDVIEITLRQQEPNSSRVVVQGKPSWFRLGVKKSEQTYSLTEAELAIKKIIHGR